MLELSDRHGNRFLLVLGLTLEVHDRMHMADKDGGCWDSDFRDELP